MSRFHNQQGFSMMEALVASAILLFVVHAVLSMSIGGHKHGIVAEHRTIATNLARAQLEAMRATPFDQIPTAFPANEMAPILLEQLPEGAWIVSYPKGIDAEPLAVKLVVQWEEERGSHEVLFSTLIADTSS